VSDPGILAYRWLADRNIELHRVANRHSVSARPAFGLLLTVLGVVYSAYYIRAWPFAELIPAAVTSGISLWLTVLAYQTNGRARRASAEGFGLL
jgi:hypothetical protein